MSVAVCVNLLKKNVYCSCSVDVIDFTFVTFKHICSCYGNSTFNCNGVCPLCDKCNIIKDDFAFYAEFFCHVAVFVCNIPAEEGVTAVTCGKIICKCRNCNLLKCCLAFGSAVCKHTAVGVECNIVNINSNNCCYCADLLCAVIICTCKCIYAVAVGILSANYFNVCKISFIVCDESFMLIVNILRLNDCSVSKFVGNNIYTVRIVMNCICSLNPYRECCSSFIVFVKRHSYICVMVLSDVIPA